MVTTIIKIGNAQGVILEAAIMEAAGLRLGDELDVAVQPDGSIILTPLRKPDGKKARKR